MPARTISEHIRVALRLAARQPQAAQDYANLPQATWFSFSAAVIALPLFIATVLAGGGEGRNLFRVIADLGPYTVGWLLFPVAMVKVAEMIQREQYYCRYITAVNWCALVEYMVMAALVVLQAVGVIPESLGKFLFVAVVIWVLTYQHFVARMALQVDGNVAAMLVALRLALDLAIVAASGILGG